MNQKGIKKTAEVDLPQMSVHPPDISLDEAANVLSEFLPTETQERIREASAGMRIPLWQMLLGYVMRCRDREEVWSPHLLSMWEDGLPASAPRRCKTCNLTFVSKFPEAQFCCNPCAFGKLGSFGHREDCPTRQHEQIMSGVLV